MRVVIDTNILISAMLKDRSPEAAILCVVSRPDFEWVVCSDILQEYLEVITRAKFAFSKDLLNRWRDILTQATVSIEAPQIAIDFPRDRKDARFLSCAMAAAADFCAARDVWVICAGSPALAFEHDLRASFDLIFTFPIP